MIIRLIVSLGLYCSALLCRGHTLPHTKPFSDQSDQELVEA